MKVLIIGYLWPEPTASAAGQRVLQLIEQCHKHAFEVSFCCAASRGTYVEMPDYVNAYETKLNHASFDELLIRISPDIVIFDRFVTEEQFSWRIDKYCPEALKVLDSEDLHCLRQMRAESKNNLENWEALKQSELTKRELASIYRCDMTLLISEYEYQLLQNSFRVPKSLLYCLPFMEATQTPMMGPSFEQREGFIFLGHFRHMPNWDCVLYLKAEIWPLIRKRLPRSNLYIYGAYPPKKAMSLTCPADGFWVKGYCVSDEAVMQNARVCLAPLRFGAGLKGKLLLAMRMNTAMVTTPIGAEGFPANEKFPARVEQSPEALANAACELYENKTHWGALTKEAQAYRVEAFCEARLGPAWVKAMSHMKAKLSEHRSNNFVGAMLMHHMSRSTEYFSRWIEEKEKSRSKS